MKLTSGKLRYLLTIDSLEKSLPRVRCIDVAVQLGISRASVCKMLSSLTKEGLLEQLPDKSLRITELGHQLTREHEEQYQTLCPIFQQLGLSEYDAQECSMALLAKGPAFKKAGPFVLPLPAGCGAIAAAGGAAGFGGGVVGRIKRIEVFAVQLLLCITEHFTKAGRLKQSGPKKSADEL